MIEYCEICNEPTGNAGRLDDSVECEICHKIICEDCLYPETPMDMSCGYIPYWCKECGKKTEREVEGWD